MKKLALLTVTALTVSGLGLGSLPMTTHAAAPQKQIFNKGNCVIISYGSDCNIQNVLDRLENCFPGIIFPGCQLPDGNLPETDAPDCDMPESEAPEVNVPDAPEVEIPQPDAPEVEIPQPDAPEVEIPQPDAPEAELPENTPDNNPGNGSTGGNAPEEHAYIKEVVRLVNIERAKEGLSPLTINTKVQAAAMVRAKECEQSFSHTRPNGTSFATALREQGVSYRSAGENIAWGQKTPAEVVTAWMNSAGHRANIMNASFTTIGVGYYENARGTDYWCQLFTR